ncbi:unnamed protein product [Phytophthora lilii]|uniref:RxLR effector protein n=1 Tax=Phytophthora lilii TaxID=2077276 RepID=A0A9W6TTC1_9STRA|nr:unnamed protein product [Phytophthora lilii]
MRLAYALLASVFAILTSQDGVSAAPTSAKYDVSVPSIESTSAEEIDNRKRFLRTADTDDNKSEDRMFVGTINGILGKVGSVIDTGGAQVVKQAPKLEKYQIWLRNNFTPSQVRVDVMGKQPWMSNWYLVQHKDFRQYAKFMVEYKRLHPNGV